MVYQLPADGWGLAVINLAPDQTRRIATGSYTSVGYSNGSAPFDHLLQPGASFTSDKGLPLPFEGDP